MNRKLLLIIGIVLISNMFLVSASLCRGLDGYYHDCSCGQESSGCGDGWDLSEFSTNKSNDYYTYKPSYVLDGYETGTRPVYDNDLSIPLDLDVESSYAKAYVQPTFPSIDYHAKPAPKKPVSNTKIFPGPYTDYIKSLASYDYSYTPSQSYSSGGYYSSYPYGFYDSGYYPGYYGGYGGYYGGYGGYYGSYGYYDGYSDYGYSTYSDVGYSDYGYSDSGYTDYVCYDCYDVYDTYDSGYVDYGYSDYGYSSGYVDYGYSDYGYSSYSDYGYY